MENKSHFDASARTWNTEETIKRNEAFAHAIKRHLHFPVERMMDFGCGTGLLTSHFLDLANEILGIETSGGMLEQYNGQFKSNDKVSSLAINLEQEPVPPDIGQFDLIMSAMAFHHLQDPKKMLSIFKEQLDHRGKIFIIDLDEEDGTFHPDNKGMGVHHFGFSKQTLET